MAALLAACPPSGGGGNPGGDLAKTYTTTLSGQVSDNPSGTTYINRNGLPVIIEVEGHEVDRTTSRTIGVIAGSYRITFDHPGTFRATASFESRTGVYSRARYTGATSGGNIILRPLSPQRRACFIGHSSLVGDRPCQSPGVMTSLVGHYLT